MTREEFIEKAFNHLREHGCVGLDKKTVEEWGFTVEQAENMLLDAADMMREREK